MLDAYSGIAGAIDAGNAVPLAVGSAGRLAVSPNLPTVAETLPGFEAVGWQVLMAPPGTPDAIIAKVNADVIKAMTDPETQKKLAALGRDDRRMSAAQTLGLHSERATEMGADRAADRAGQVIMERA